LLALPKNSEEEWSAVQRRGSRRPEQSSSAIGSNATTGQLVVIEKEKVLEGFLDELTRTTTNN